MGAYTRRLAVSCPTLDMALLTPSDSHSSSLNFATIRERQFSFTAAGCRYSHNDAHQLLKLGRAKTGATDVYDSFPEIYLYVISIYR
jgi:hypothetical protein